MSNISLSKENEESFLNDQINPLDSSTVLKKVDIATLIKHMPENEENIHEKINKIKWILCVLKRDYFKANEDKNNTKEIEIVIKLCQLMRPLAEIQRHNVEEMISKELQLTCHSFINICMQLLDHFMSFFSFLVTHPEVNSKITQALATYQIKTDPWYSLDNYNLSLKILDTYKKYLVSKEILERILIEDIRSYFSSHQNEPIFSENLQVIKKKPLYRPYENVLKESGVSSTERWKTEKIECSSIFEWILSVSEKNTIEKNLFLIIPPIVILLEDVDPSFKLKSTRCLHHLLSKCDSALIIKTGIGNLFWKLLIQCLSYHPPSINISISIPLLRTSLNNLMMLALLMEPESKKQRSKLYDEIMYSGVFNGMLYSGEHVNIVALFMEYTEKLVSVMGIYAVKHIKTLIPLISSVLEKPFQISHPECLKEASKALKAIMSECWPRIIHYHAVILQGICICWLNIRLQENTITDEIKKELCCCIGALKKLMGDELEKDVKKLIETDKNLASLFKNI